MEPINCRALLEQILCRRWNQLVAASSIKTQRFRIPALSTFRVFGTIKLPKVQIGTYHFKSVTEMSPVQFQKQIRVQEARRMMLALPALLNESRKHSYQLAPYFNLQELVQIFRGAARLLWKCGELYHPWEDLPGTLGNAQDDQRHRFH